MYIQQTKVDPLYTMISYMSKLKNIYISLTSLSIPVEIVQLSCLKLPLKLDKTKIIMINDSLMKVESIAECPHWDILQYF